MSAGGRRRVLSSEERALWATFTKTIEPMHSSPLPSGEVGAGDAPPEKVQSGKSRAPLSEREKERKGVPAPPPLAPLGRRMRTRVARGKETIDARIDLHGLTQAQAHSALLHFLRNAQARDARLVLVITGKGGRGDSERGVLRRQVPHWLELAEFRTYVVGYEDAGVRHGGEGALYVRVRRTRQV
jgi:DNA-nicking Smr family endonuclease